MRFLHILEKGKFPEKCIDKFTGISDENKKFTRNSNE